MSTFILFETSQATSNWKYIGKPHHLLFFTKILFSLLISYNIPIWLASIYKQKKQVFQRWLYKAQKNFELRSPAHVTLLEIISSRVYFQLLDGKKIHCSSKWRNYIKKSWGCHYSQEKPGAKYLGTSEDLIYAYDISLSKVVNHYPTITKQQTVDQNSTFVQRNKLFTFCGLHLIRICQT